MKLSTSLVKGFGILATVSMAIMGTASATSLVVPQTKVCVSIALDNTKLLNSISITLQEDISKDLWSVDPSGKCVTVSRDRLMGAAPRGTSFYVWGVDNKRLTHLLEKRDVAMFRTIQNTSTVVLNYHINNISTNSIPHLIGTVYNEYFSHDNGKISPITQKGIYRSDMEDIYALDTMRQIDATKYTKLADFQGKNTITREQAAKFFVMAWRAINPGKGIPTSAAGCSFIDARTMDHSLINSVQLACQLGLMKGSAGKFNPRNTLTLAEAITILIRMQYGKMEEGGAIWYTNYFNKAYDVELFAHYAYNPHVNEGNDVITREMIAFLIRRLLEINNIAPKYYNTI